MSDDGITPPEEGPADGGRQPDPQDQQAQHGPQDQQGLPRGSKGLDAKTKKSKAEARAARKAKRERDAMMSAENSGEAPRLTSLGEYDSESARFFGGGGVVSARDDDGDVLVKGKDAPDLEVKEEEEMARRSEKAVEAIGEVYSSGDIGENGRPSDVVGEEEAEETTEEEEEHTATGTAKMGASDKDLAGPVQESVDVKDEKAAARARRKAARDARLANSVEAPRMTGYEGESERFYLGDSPVRGVGASIEEGGGEKFPIPESKAFVKGSGGDSDEKKEPQIGETPQSTDSSLSGVAKHCGENGGEGNRHIGRFGLTSEDLQTETSLASAARGKRTDSDLGASDVSLGLLDLQHSTQSDVGHLASDGSLFLEDLDQGEAFEEDPKFSDGSLVLEDLYGGDLSEDMKLRSMPLMSRQVAKTNTLHTSMLPRKKSFRESSSLRRSASEGPAVFPDSRPKRPEFLDELKKKPTVQRGKRARVARLNDGKLDSSMNSSGLKHSALIALADSLGGKSTIGDLGASRRKSADIVPSASKRAIGEIRRSFESGLELRRISHNGSNLDRLQEVNEEHTRPPAVDRNDNSTDSIELATVTTHPKSPTAEEDDDPRGDDQEEHFQEDENVAEEKYRPSSSKNVNSLGWTTFRRYRKRRSGNIEMMDNQFFIPPQEEGSHFFESLFYTLHGSCTDFVMWIYQASFFHVLALFFLGYYALVFMFAGILVAMEARRGGRCGLDVYDSWGKSHSLYELAFELSWTTFTTVGYGIVSPSDEDNCYPIRFACSLFAFMGLLYNSLSCAIFFSKLERVLTSASVTFSSSVCLQFGKAASHTRGSKGVYGQFWMGSNSMRSLANIKVEASGGSKTSTNTFDGDASGRMSQSEQLHYTRQLPRACHNAPHPFLEFRLINDHANSKDRAVRNGHVTAMVQLNARDADDAKSLSSRSAGTFHEFVALSTTTQHSKDESTRDEVTSPEESGNKRPIRFSDDARTRRTYENINATFRTSALIVQETDAGVEEGSGPEGRVYYPLRLEPDTHPHFRRVWYIRHTLNEKSPLLKKNVREKIKKDGGWDPRNCQHQDIMASLVDFNRIRVTFKGVSAASNALVFHQKVYTVEDLYVGWQFAQIFYRKERSLIRRLLWPSRAKQAEDENGRDSDDNIVLDKRLIHDILPQEGGGHEPIEG